MRELADAERKVWDTARMLETKITEMETERATVPRSERRPINQRLHLLRGLLDWVNSRAGMSSHPHNPNSIVPEAAAVEAVN